MNQHELPLEDVKDLAEQVIADKRDEVADETQARELYDVPAESAGDLARKQADDRDN